MTAIIKQISSRLNSKFAGKVQLIKPSEQRLYQDALTRAFAAWAPQNWEWVDYLFNEHFLAHRVAPLLTTGQQAGTRLDSIKLANIWAEQLAWFDDEMKQRHIVKLIPAAAEFLHCLEAELQPYAQIFSTTGKGVYRFSVQINNFNS